MDRTVTRFKNGEIVEVYKRDVEWDELLHQRDSLLRKSDWRALKDVTLSVPWRDYRQALRDLPQEHDTANDAADNWPVMPDE